MRSACVFPFYRTHDVRAGARSVIDGQAGGELRLLRLSRPQRPSRDHRAPSRSATAEWGTSVSASRITAGERDFHRELEQALADIYETEAALAFVSGHATAVSTIAALLGPQGPDPARRPDP